MSRVDRIATAYWVEAPGRGALRRQPLPTPGPGEVEIVAHWSGISSGTERLVGRGRVPAAAGAAMACPGMQGTFALPVSYGYSLVGEVAGTSERVFTMHPHHDRAVVARERLVPLPLAVPPARATLLPNLETALNAVWDAELRAGEPTVVVGGGAIGLLLAFVLALRHDGPCTLIERTTARRAFAARLPWIERVLPPEELVHGAAAAAFHTTATSEGLQLALEATGFEGRVVELSWYGDEPVAMRLGGSFHHDRKRIVGSQVAAVAPSHRTAGRAARTAAVLDLLHEPQLDRLHGPPIPFVDLPAFFARLYGGEVVEACPLVAY
ncbi:MAG: zinc-binding alcohol dehydrogenase [Planctomycetes bacterium]|nr:zinc-binding alcohol dehydrogenase [Planctomycetota bacterium]